MIFDFRADPANAGGQADVNTFTLVHETIHLLCFNTGLLARKADVPDCISEGLATYGELWTPPTLSTGLRRRSIACGSMPSFKELDNGTPWIPISQFITDDDVFRKPETAQIAYAESWVLVHYLLEHGRAAAEVPGLPRRLAEAGRQPGDEPGEIRGIAAGIAARTWTRRSAGTPSGWPGKPACGRRPGSPEDRVEPHVLPHLGPLLLVVHQELAIAVVLAFLLALGGLITRRQ